MKHLGKTMLAAGALAAAFLSPAAAADLPVKAPAAAPAFAYPTSGLYFGANAAVDAGSATTVQGIASSALYGGDIGVTAGYTRPLWGTWVAVEGLFDLSTLQSGSSGATAAAVLSANRSADFEQRFMVGVPASTLSQLLNYLGINDALPSVTGVVSQPLPYVFASLHEQDVSFQLGNALGKNWAFSWGLGGGMINKLPNGAVIDTWLEYRNGTNALLIGPAPLLSAQIGNSIKVGVSYKIGSVDLSKLNF